MLFILAKWKRGREREREGTNVGDSAIANWQLCTRDSLARSLLKSALGTFGHMLIAFYRSQPATARQAALFMQQIVLSTSWLYHHVYIGWESERVREWERETVCSSCNLFKRFMSFKAAPVVAAQFSSVVSSKCAEWKWEREREMVAMLWSIRIVHHHQQAIVHQQQQQHEGINLCHPHHQQQQQPISPGVSVCCSTKGQAEDWKTESPTATATGTAA